MSGGEKSYPYPGADPSAPPADAPPPYYHQSYHQSPATAGAAMMYPSIPGATAAPGQVMMHGHKMPPSYVPPAGHNVGQPYYPAGPSQMYVPMPYPQAVPQPMYPAQGYPQPGPPPPYGGAVATMAIPLAPQQQHLVIGAQFDAGARFNHISRPSIPPPPPGCMPNAAQMAMMSGQQTTVVAEQKKGGLFKGSGSGGIKFW